MKYDEERLRGICIKWEAIRRNREYTDDYIRYLEISADGMQDLVEEWERWGKEKALAGNVNIGSSISKIAKKLTPFLMKWNMSDLIDPNYSFLAEIFPGNVFTYEEKVVNRLVWIFGWGAIFCTEGATDFGLMGTKKLPGFHKTNLSSDEEFRQRKYINIRVDITRGTTEIKKQVGQLIDLYKRRRIENGLEKAPKAKSRKRQGKDPDIFKIYDRVCEFKKKHGKINWTRIAKELSPNYDGNNYHNLADRIKDQACEARRLIYGGFRDFD